MEERAAHRLPRALPCTRQRHRARTHPLAPPLRSFLRTTVRFDVARSRHYVVKYLRLYVSQPEFESGGAMWIARFGVVECLMGALLLAQVSLFVPLHFVRILLTI